MTCHTLAMHEPPDIPGEAARAARRPRWWRWVGGLVGGVLLLVVAGVIVFVVATRNPSPSAFYDPPDDLDGEAPGTILRSAPFTAGIPAGAAAWKVLYVSTDEHDDPVAVSGLVIAPLDAPAGPRPVLAWAHGTTGIDRACAPSNSDAPLEGVPDMTGPLERGWVLTLTDYQGLGTPGPHPYLVAGSAARSVLDSVRAVHELADDGTLDLELADDYAIWGHSQGGHAALAAGGLAGDYLPELPLVGVAALAPATRLQDNLAAIEGTQPGNVLTMFAVESWTEYYPDLPAEVFNDRGRATARIVRTVCVNQPSRFRIIAAGLIMPDDILAIDPTTDPDWSARLDANSPDPAAITAPVLVGQGLADEIIDAGVTTDWVRDRCAGGSPTDWRTYPDINHVGVVGPGGADALSWTIDRFAGDEFTDRCPV